MRRAVATAPRPAAVPARLSVEQVNALNIALMVVAAAIAWVAPFELLLIAYATLGPLHYLTEISWLHDRGYFTTGRYDAVPLIALGVLGSLEHAQIISWDGSVVLALGAAAVFAFVRERRRKLALLGGAVLASLAWQRWGVGWMFLLVMLPTVIHVYCFTGLFILAGSIKSRSAVGYASFAVFLACGIGMVLYRPPAAQYAVSVRTAALGSQFGPVFDQLALLTGGRGWDALAAFGRFLAFAYTYHYLNWFSKTGIIRWHAMSGARMALVGVTYAAALALYAINYETGLVALFVISLIHVLLEFPLDLRTLATVAGRRGWA